MSEQAGPTLPPPAPRKKSRRKWWIIGAIVVIIIIIAAASGGGKKNDDDKASPTTSGAKSVQASGSRSAAADVAIKTCANEPTLDVGQPIVTVTNHSSKASDYSITVAIESPDGSTQVDTATALVESLQPGQATDATAYGSKSIPDGSVCKVAEVTRFAS